MDKLTNEELELKKIEEEMDPEILAAFENALEEVEKEENREKSKAEILATYISRENKKEILATKSNMELAPPENLTKEDVKTLLSDIFAYPELASIVALKGKKNVYYYNKEMWTEKFANVQALIMDKDILSTIATMARYDCKTYPRPLPMSMLLDAPYNYSEDEVLGALARMKFEEEYSDIGTVKASNGKIGIYSSTYMSEKYAKALCEEIEVEWMGKV